MNGITDTKNTIIETAAELIHSNGFRSTSINEIIDKIGVSKGAFFHYFKDKNELGNAIIEYWHKELYMKWVKPLEDSSDPLSDLYNVPYRIYSEYTIEDIAKGCPLANLATELSPVNESFRLQIMRIYDMLEKGVSDAIMRGQDMGQISRDLDPVKLARFYEDLMAGSRSVSKNTLNKSRLLETLEIFKTLLDNKSQ